MAEANAFERREHAGTAPERTPVRPQLQSAEPEPTLPEAGGYHRRHTETQPGPEIAPDPSPRRTRRWLKSA